MFQSLIWKLKHASLSLPPFPPTCHGISFEIFHGTSVFLSVSVPQLNRVRFDFRYTRELVLNTTTKMKGHGNDLQGLPISRYLNILKIVFLKWLYIIIYLIPITKNRTPT